MNIQRIEERTNLFEGLHYFYNGYSIRFRKRDNRWTLIVTSNGTFALEIPKQFIPDIFRKQIAPPNELYHYHCAKKKVLDEIPEVV